MRMIALPGLLILMAGVAWVACAQGQRSTQPTPADRLAIANLLIGDKHVRARVVWTRADRRRGLGGVRQLAPDEGMLFVYPDLEPRQFWMRDCLLALDIAFLGEAGRVLQLETLLPARGGQEQVPRTRLSPPSAYVLEVAAGFFQANGLGVGTVVRIPGEIRRSAAE